MLYQSGIPKPHLAARHKVSLVLNMSYEQPVDFARFNHAANQTPPMQIVNPIFDGPISTVDMDRVHWLASFAADHIRGGGVVLSHCQMGWNRSGLVSGLTMLELGFQGDIVKTIQEARGRGALSNVGFRNYLQLLQEGLPRDEALDALTRPRGRALDSTRMDIAMLEEEIEAMSDEQLQEWLDRMGF